jgi:putative ABC transport system permease protein
MQKTSLGFDKDHIAIIPYNNALNEKYEAFRNELLSNSNFKEVGRSSRIPSGRLLDALDASTVAADSLQAIKTDIKFLAVDYDFIPTYGIPMAAGRNFSKQFGTDTLSFILNESAVKAIGWKTNENAVGKELCVWWHKRSCCWYSKRLSF